MSQQRKNRQTDARKRAELILKVQSGQMTATEAAKELGVSRKTYYKWENRALQAMLGALEDRPCGRPSRPVDGEKENLKSMMTNMQKHLLMAEQRAHIQTYLREDMELDQILMKKGAKKK